MEFAEDSKRREQQADPAKHQQVLHFALP